MPAKNFFEGSDNLKVSQRRLCQQVVQTQKRSGLVRRGIYILGECIDDDALACRLILAEFTSLGMTYCT